MSTPSVTANVTPNDRLGFTMFLAVALHAALILGIGFSWAISQQSSPTIEVTLSQHNDADAPEDADFISDANQIGSGEASEALIQTTEADAKFFVNEEQEVIPDPLLQQLEEQIEEKQAQLTTISNSDWAVNNQQAEPTEATEGFSDIDKTIEELAREIASLEAQLAAVAQAQAKGPRVRRIDSASTRRTADAHYLDSWRVKVESIGNLNYPEEARRRQLFGDVTLLVTVRPDGSLKDVKVLETSGHQVIDDAALRIVRLAAPYPPFPDEMRQSTDLLEIVRSWQFRRPS